MNSRMAPKWNKKVVIALASVGLVGSIGTGVFFAYNDNASEKVGHQAEEKVKSVSKSNLDRILGEDNSKKKDTKKDVLQGILTKEKEKSDQFAAIIDSKDGSKTLSSGEVALAVINTLPADTKTTVKTNEPVDKPILIPAVNTPTPIPTPTPVPPVVPIDDSDNDDKDKDDVIVPPVDVNHAPFLYADNQTIHIGSNFNPYRYATAMDEEDGDLTSSVQVVSNNVNPDKEGSYSVTYKVTDSAGKVVERSIAIEVVNDAPVLHVVNREVSVGDTFNPLESVSAYDTEDGDISSRIQVTENNVNNQVPGTYSVTYEVTDFFGKSTTETIQVQVVNDKPTISASDKELNVGDVFDPLDGVRANDKQDGDLTSVIRVQANDVDTTKAGTYHVTYVVEDSAGAIVEKTVVITVKEKNTAPEIQMNTETINLNVGANPDWKVGVTANDQEDGDITNAITVNATDVNLEVPGNYIVIYQVTDSGGLTTTKEVAVTVE
ncbi:immunoglobulin-like domain-containing protein [Listeria monocytogenes]